MLIETLSQPLHRALLQGNSTAAAYNEPYLPQQAEPGVALPADVAGAPASPLVDGVWPQGFTDQGGAAGPNRLLLLPIGSGFPGTVFTMRLIGWRIFGHHEQSRVWIPCPLAEFGCIVGDIPGPQPPQGTRPQAALLPDERLCQTVALLDGALGRGGEVVSFGGSSQLVAFALVDLRGCQKWGFDFATTDDVAMNCLWARC